MEEKFAVITGASTGIGKAIALEFAKQRACTIILAGRNEKDLKAVKQEIEAAGGKAIFSFVDLSDFTAIKFFIADIRSKAKIVHVVVNAAGVWHGLDELYANTNLEDYEDKIVMDTLMVGTVAPTLLVHGLIPLMPPESTVINISGTFEHGAKGWLPYYVSKRALEDLTIGLAEELRDKHIRVNCISPSDTATEAYKKFFPQYYDTALQPSEIAKFAVQLCKQDFNETGKVFVMQAGKKVTEEKK